MSQPAPSAQPADTPAWHSLPAAEAIRRMETDSERGLSADEARRRQDRYGRNELSEGPRRTLFHMVVDQFRDVMIWVLLAAVLISLLMGDVTDALVIVAIVVLNAVMGVAQESKAEQSLAALKRLAAPMTRVLRDGKVTEIPSAEVVPGDVVVLEAGNFIPADLRLLETVRFKVEEASLTGESVPVEKHAGEVTAVDAGLGDRVNMAYSGTTAVNGRARGLVTAVGAETELGKIAGMLGGVEAEKTPLQQRLEELGKWLALLVIGICAVVFVAGWLRGLPLQEMLLTAVSLAVAAIPEGLPAVVTVVLALGMRHMVHRRVIVRRLRAVEALGSTTVICTDKTGTLTQNEMTVRRFRAGPAEGEVTGIGYEPEGELRMEGQSVDLRQHPALERLLQAGVLCNDAALQREDGGWKVTGDPTEAALLVAAAKADIPCSELVHRMPRVAEVPFDSDRKRMSTIHRLPQGGYRIMVKGAPDVVLDCSTHHLSAEGEERPLEEGDRAADLETNRRFAEEALRVLGFAYRDLDQSPGDLRPEVVERDLVFLGLVGMIDPPREEARQAVRVCRRAGVRPVMITGDYPTTAQAIARELEWSAAPARAVSGAELQRLSDAELQERVEDVSVYARVSPADKLRIVEAWQARGQVVAMTGDGVNDAPALKQSDIGVAMGVAGTDVARGAADIVLMDDNFASIVAAVEEGRGIFDNIRKFVFYLLSCNISEVLAIFLAIMAGLPQPLLAVQILWVNLVTDGLPALALGVEPKEPGLMERPPRDPEEGVLNGEVVRDIIWYGAFITLATLAAYAHGLYWLCLVPQGYSGLEAVQAALAGGFWGKAEIQDGLTEARTMAFGTLAFAQLLHALNARSEVYSLFRLGLFTNPQLLGAIALSALGQLAVIYLPFMNRIFETTPVGGRELVVGVVLSLSPLAFGEVRKWLIHRQENRGAALRV